MLAKGVGRVPEGSCTRSKTSASSSAVSSRFSATASVKPVLSRNAFTTEKESSTGCRSACEVRAQNFFLRCAQIRARLVVILPREDFADLLIFATEPVQLLLHCSETLRHLAVHHS